ncbi:hypothetical protein LY78DRAFT_21335 [Colletotrichum sublineola]|nr:hypothetical protein LY78DRAFT_21335 [Colletotrichum sublineola]
MLLIEKLAVCLILGLLKVGLFLGLGLSHGGVRLPRGGGVGFPGANLLWVGGRDPSRGRLVFVFVVEPAPSFVVTNLRLRLPVASIIQFDDSLTTGGYSLHRQLIIALLCMKDPKGVDEVVLVAILVVLTDCLVHHLIRRRRTEGHVWSPDVDVLFCGHVIHGRRLFFPRHGRSQFDIVETVSRLAVSIAVRLSSALPYKFIFCLFYHTACFFFAEWYVDCWLLFGRKKIERGKKRERERKRPKQEGFCLGRKVLVWVELLGRFFLLRDLQFHQRSQTFIRYLKFSSKISM